MQYLAPWSENFPDSQGRQSPLSLCLLGSEPWSSVMNVLAGHFLHRSVSGRPTSSWYCPEEQVAHSEEALKATVPLLHVLHE